MRINVYRLFHVPVKNQLSVVKHDASCTKLANRVHIMADIEHGTAFRICCIAHFAEAFLLELHIADGENLVHNHDFAVQMRGNGKRKFNIHAD